MKNAAGIEIFDGFKIQYPEYLVLTPQTLKEFTIRSLTVSEEEKLKASLLTPTKLAQHLNEVIYNCLIKKPEDIKSYEDFLNKITIKDRDALMYGLYHVTYKDIHNYDVTCGGCEFVNSVKVNFLKSFRAVTWPKTKKETVLEAEVPVNFEVAKGIRAIVRQPKLADEANLLKETTFATDELRDLQMQLLVIKRFEMDVLEAKAPDSITERENIFKGYNQLPSTDRKMIDKAYIDNFGKYTVDVACKVKCQRCGKEEDVTIDLVRQFFRSMYE
jgi:hypothetical protein